MDFSKNLRIKLNPSVKVIATPWSVAVVLNQRVILFPPPVDVWPCLQALEAITMRGRRCM